MSLENLGFRFWRLRIFQNELGESGIRVLILNFPMIMVLKLWNRGIHFEVLPTATTVEFPSFSFHKKYSVTISFQSVGKTKHLQQHCVFQEPYPGKRYWPDAKRDPSFIEEIEHSWNLYALSTIIIWSTLSDHYHTFEQSGFSENSPKKINVTKLRIERSVIRPGAPPYELQSQIWMIFDCCNTFLENNIFWKNIDFWRLRKIQFRSDYWRGDGEESEWAAICPTGAPTATRLQRRSTGWNSGSESSHYCRAATPLVRNMNALACYYRENGILIGWRMLILLRTIVKKYVSQMILQFLIVKSSIFPKI